jgi:hypothetical protein
MMKQVVSSSNTIGEIYHSYLEPHGKAWLFYIDPSGLTNYAEVASVPKLDDNQEFQFNLMERDRFLAVIEFHSAEENVSPWLNVSYIANPTPIDVWNSYSTWYFYDSLEDCKRAAQQFLRHIPEIL